MLKEKIGEGTVKLSKQKNILGSFGQVFKGVHRITQEVRAIKRINKSAVDAVKTAKLMQEIEILKQLVILRLKQYKA